MKYYIGGMGKGVLCLLMHLSRVYFVGVNKSYPGTYVTQLQPAVVVRLREDAAGEGEAEAEAKAAGEAEADLAEA